MPMHRRYGAPIAEALHKFIGIHWGTFELAEEPYDEPPHRIAAEVDRLKLDPNTILLPRPGETRG